MFLLIITYQYPSLAMISLISKSWTSIINIDIDECQEGTDECSRSVPAPATCINEEGSYRCSCANYVGYRLSPDGRSCEGCVLRIYRDLVYVLNQQ